MVFPLSPPAAMEDEAGEPLASLDHFIIIHSSTQKTPLMHAKKTDCSTPNKIHGRAGSLSRRWLGWSVISADHTSVGRSQEEVMMSVAASFP